MADIIERLREHAEIHESHIPHDDEQRGWADDLRKAADEIDRLRDKARLYEELRSVIDGGSESMTHKDAHAEVKYLQSRVAELEAARRCDDCYEPTGPRAICETCAGLRCESVIEAAKVEPVAWMLKTGHGTTFATVKPECEIDLWAPLYTAPLRARG